MDKIEIVENAVEAAKKTQIRDDLCSRSTMYGLQSVFDFIPDSMVKASASLAGGCGSASGSCGAYCSGLLAVGLLLNSTMEEEAGDPASFEKTAAAFNEYRDRFMAELGTTYCPEIQKGLFGRSYRLYDANELKDYMALPGHAEKCAEVVGLATRIAAEMIVEHNSAGPAIRVVGVEPPR
ncbi:MAG: C-GCAxxG-C-C family protein [Oscillospiraceae bacterium]|nr:C-GCAxxG-C-C family protein [Oscillospiraceae bacterium]